MTEPAPLNVLALLGSLRAKSFNRMLLGAAHELAPAGMRITDHPPLDALPHFNQDLEDAGDPAAVTAFKAKLAETHAVLVVSAEYNSGAPGVLKNAIDWGSRGKSPWRGMPVAMLSASPGGLGGSRMQAQLRQTFAGMGAFVLPGPDVVVGGAAGRFDDQGRLADAPTREVLAAYLVRFAAFARAHRV